MRLEERQGKQPRRLYTDSHASQMKPPTEWNRGAMSNSDEFSPTGGDGRERRGRTVEAEVETKLKPTSAGEAPRFRKSSSSRLSGTRPALTSPAAPAPAPAAAAAAAQLDFKPRPLCPRLSPDMSMAPATPRDRTEKAQNAFSGPHPSFIQVANPYIFEQKVQCCLTALGSSEAKEDNIRLQGVLWIDSVRKALQL